MRTALRHPELSQLCVPHSHFLRRRSTSLRQLVDYPLPRVQMCTVLAWNTPKYHYAFDFLR
ncbi:hypothetical protein X975_10713, partial [Stegodyphus mimosarum]